MSSLGLIILGRFLSGLGYQMIVLEGVTEIYSSTHSVFMTGALGMALFIPTLFTNYFAGLWAERAAQRGLIYFCLQMAFAFACGVLYFDHSPVVTVAVFFFLSTVRTLRTPFFYFLARGNGGRSAARLSQLSMLSWQLPLVLGPLIYSSLRSTFSAGVVAFTLTLIAGIAAWPQRVDDGKFPSMPDAIIPGAISGKLESQTTRKFSHPIREFFSAHKVWFEASALDVLVIGSLSFGSLIPYFLERMHSDPGSIGYVRAATSLGSLICLWFFDHQMFRTHRKTVFIYAVLVACAVVFAIPTAGSILSLMFLCLSFGFLDGFSILYRDFLTFSVSKETFGRVSSIGQVFNSASEDLGEFRAGMMGNWLGPEYGLRAGAVIGAATGLGILAWRWALVNSKSMVFSEIVSDRDIHN